MAAGVTDKDARTQILNKFYEIYRQQGLHFIVNEDQVADDLGLDRIQVKRCFDYLAAKGLMRRMTRGGGFSPTVELIDAVEDEGAQSS